MKLFIHIGMPKCGSSALQTYLSHNPVVLNTNRNKFEYVAIQPDGSLLSGIDLTRIAASSEYDYVSTGAAKNFQRFGQAAKNNFMKQVCLLSERSDGLIISSEGWGQKAELFGEDCLFANSDFDIHVITYVRPQVPWFNSAWWQWGAWSDYPLRRWVNENRNAANWYRHAASWADKKWVSNLTIRMLPPNVIEDFSGILGVQVRDKSLSNQSLPGSLLRLFQRNRELRAGPHDSAIEFILARRLKLNETNTPWVLRPQIIEKIIDHFRESNKKLLSMLSQDQAEAMSRDSRWWDLTAYESFEFEKPGPVKIDAAQVDKIAVSALKALARCDEEIKLLNEQIHHLKMQKTN